MNVEYEFKVNNITYMNFDMGFEEVSDTMPVTLAENTYNELERLKNEQKE